jgi:hypothetical protein
MDIEFEWNGKTGWLRFSFPPQWTGSCDQDDAVCSAGLLLGGELDYRRKNFLLTLTRQDSTSASGTFEVDFGDPVLIDSVRISVRNGKFRATRY